MIVKRLRHQRSWSQDQLSTMSGLSIRTIQRIERGDRASLESLKALAAVFEVDTQTLEQEIMVIDKDSKQWKQNPLWLRVVFWGSNLTWLNSRREALLFEAFIVLIAVSMLMLSIFHPVESKRIPFVYLSLIATLCAYMWSALVRLSDKYGIWLTDT